MQGIILCAGKSTRTYPLTLTRPKPILKVANKTLIEYNLDSLEGKVAEVILVVGYKKDMIIDFVETIKDRYSFSILFVEQKQQKGTSDALLTVKDNIKDKFILLMGDNIYSNDDVVKCLNFDNSILVKEVENPELYGVVVENNGILVNIIEKPQLAVSNLINCAMYTFTPEIFSMIDKVNISKRGEYEITDAIEYLAMEQDVHCVKSKLWFDIKYPWDLFDADSYFRKGKKNIGENCKINGEVINSSIGNNCIIDGRICDSIIMDNVMVKSGSVIEKSILGKGVVFEGKAESGEKVRSIVRKKPIIVKKLGAIVADDVKCEDVVIKPGCKVWSGKHIKGEIKKDII